MSDVFSPPGIAPFGLGGGWRLGRASRREEMAQKKSTVEIAIFCHKQPSLFFCSLNLSDDSGVSPPTEVPESHRLSSLTFSFSSLCKILPVLHQSHDGNFINKHAYWLTVNPPDSGPLYSHTNSIRLYSGSAGVKSV